MNLSDTLVEESTKQFAELLFTVAKGLGGKALEYIKSKGQNSQNYFHEVSQKYVTRFYKRHGVIQVLGMNEPMTLANVFVDVKMLDSLNSNKFLSIESLKEAFTKSKGPIRDLNSNGSDYKEDGIKLAERESRLMVVGAPGGGKSTFLKKIGIQSLFNKNSKLKNYIPIFVELKNIDASNDINALIVKELEIAGFPHPKTFLEKVLSDGKIILLFDGLDEVDSEFEAKTIRQIKDFCDQYYKNKFVVSCRVAAYKGGLTNFKNVEIANLDESQIEAFISKWFEEKNKHNPNYTDISKQCLETLIRPEYHSTLELAQSPLLLTLLCLVFNSQQDFPKNRALLYREAIDILLKEWNAEKRIHSNAIYKEMTLPFEELLLSHLAHHYFVKGDYFFDKRDLSQFISEYVSENLNAPKFLDGSDILKAISIQQGILIERAKNIYSFSHLTFQEYFTAKYIDDHNLIDEYTELYCGITKWREIFILLCGIMKAGSDRLLTAINNDARTYLAVNEVSNIISTLKNLSDSSILTDRLVDLYLLLLFATDFRVMGIGTSISNNSNRLLRLCHELDSDLYELLSGSWIEDQRLDNAMHFKLYTNLVQELNPSKIVDALKVCLLDYPNHKSMSVLKAKFCELLGIKTITVDKQTSTLFNDYIDRLIFLLHCKKSSILVSKQKWNKIEASIFT